MAGKNLTPQNSEPLQVALVGYGHASKTFHAPLITSVEGMRLSYVVSSSSSKVKKDWPDVPVKASLKEALADAAVELVVIATPNDTHFELARQALASGKNVIVDKPFTTSIAEGVDLITLAEKSNRLLSVFHNRRWDADYLTLRKLLAEGRLGEVVEFESHFDRFRPEVGKRWRERPGPGGGLWYDLGPHLVDQVVELFGIPESVDADLEAQRVGAEAVDYFHVLLRYGRRRVILHGSCLVSRENARFSVHGTKGSFTKQGLDKQEDALKKGVRPGGLGWGRDPRDGTLTTWQDGVRHVEKIPSIRGNYLAYYEGIRDAIRKNAPNPVSGEEAVTVMAVLEKAQQSSSARCEFPLNLTGYLPVAAQVQAGGQQ
jgi:predicted dehydrogenase